MCNCITSIPISLSITKFCRLAPNRFNRKAQFEAVPNFYFPNDSKLSNAGSKSGRSLFLCARSSGNKGLFGSEVYGFRAELGFKEKGDNHFDFETNRGKMKKNQNGRERKNSMGSVGPEFLELRGGVEEEKDDSRRSRESLDHENLVRVVGGDGDGEEELVQESGRVGLKKVKQVVRRSTVLAKQVISVRSALSLGFVSQLWVDTNSWVVLFVEVRTNLLSGESERFLLEDVSQVGDVVLVADESVIDNEFKMIGLETLVGYKVVTPGRRNIGKVRGYTFNINSGAIESLELDSFGISIIPSSLVSTYALLVEDVLEVVSDAVVVHEAAASHIQRLTKGFLDTQNAGTSIDDLEEYSDFERPERSRNNRDFRGRKFRPRNRETEDDWELPMDYL
ncbi:hypothetical protein FNV43_RR08608 [Rhamnella rubrinervis]|uniref:PRC-barrel domain-containing protein n=1 Tax=Rhamnella rubrinervis TaxID=2594499 RepID=A0A8K0H8I3_9ROSA|nr:hypothetical protein FNV43_RR08608 [Rhamnella rubrinervis]